MSILFVAFTACNKDDVNPKNVSTNQNPNPTSGTVTDIDGNVYHTVTIGTQVWMVENLKVTHFRNGDSIPYLATAMEWSSAIGCSDYNNSSANGSTYGKLYSWYVVRDMRRLAPTGWHIPTVAEWNTLQAYLGDSMVAGGKMKETGTVHWFSPNTGATNESGFTALPGGYRDSNGSFVGGTLGGNASWWAYDELSQNLAFYRFIQYNNDNLLGGGVATTQDKFCGLSVRCIKD
jgi:uncharacterized protein (TIGR02145 family)